MVGIFGGLGVPDAFGVFGVLADDGEFVGTFGLTDVGRIGIVGLTGWFDGTSTAGGWDVVAAGGCGAAGWGAGVGGVGGVATASVAGGLAGVSGAAY